MPDTPAIATPKPFVPLNPPPTDGHGLNTGLSTELGDSARIAFGKINAGFAHLYSLVTGTPPTGAPATAKGDVVTQLLARVRALEGRPTVSDVAQVAKTEFDAVVAKVEALENQIHSATPGPAIETVAKADFDALQTRFNTLAGKLGHIFDIDAPPPPPPA